MYVRESMLEKCPVLEEPGRNGYQERAELNSSDSVDGKVFRDLQGLSSGCNPDERKALCEVASSCMSLVRKQMAEDRWGGPRERELCDGAYAEICSDPITADGLSPDNQMVLLGHHGSLPLILGGRNRRTSCDTRRGHGCIVEQATHRSNLCHTQSLANHMTMMLLPKVGQQTIMSTLSDMFMQFKYLIQVPGHVTKCDKPECWRVGFQIYPVAGASTEPMESFPVVQLPLVRQERFANVWNSLVTGEITRSNSTFAWPSISVLDPVKKPIRLPYLVEAEKIRQKLGAPDNEHLAGKEYWNTWVNRFKRLQTDHRVHFAKTKRPIGGFVVFLVHRYVPERKADEPDIFTWNTPLDCMDRLYNTVVRNRISEHAQEISNVTLSGYFSRQVPIAEMAPIKVFEGVSEKAIGSPFFSCVLGTVYNGWAPPTGPGISLADIDRKFYETPPLHLRGKAGPDGTIKLSFGQEYPQLPKEVREHLPT